MASATAAVKAMDMVKVYVRDLAPTAQVTLMSSIMDREFLNWDAKEGATITAADILNWKTSERTRHMAASYFSPGDDDTGKVARITTAFVQRFAALSPALNAADGAVEYKAWRFFKSNPNCFRMFMQMADLVRQTDATQHSGQSAAAAGQTIAHDVAQQKSALQLQPDQLIVQRIEVVETPAPAAAAAAAADSSSSSSSSSSGGGGKAIVLFTSDSKEKVKEWVKKNIDLNDHKRMARISITESGFQMKAVKPAAAAAPPS